MRISDNDLSNNLVQNSWSEDFGKDSGSTDNVQECTDGDLLLGKMDQSGDLLPSENTSFSEIEILHSCTQALDDDGQNVKASTKTQTGNKPYSCNQCEYFSSCLSNLKRHLRVHTGERPFSCTQCDYSCSHSSSLKTHIRTHTGEKPFRCTKCDYSCANAGTLNKHVRVHTGEKPYRCIHCDYSFNRSYNLNQHMTRVHTGEKPEKLDLLKKKT